MTKWILGAVALAVVLCLSVPAPAEIILASDWSGSDDVAAQVDERAIDVGIDYDKPYGAYQTDDKVCYDDCGKGGKGGYGHCRRGRLFFDVEFQFMRYFEEGGVTGGAGEPAQFDYDFTPKFEVGFVGPAGLGVRSRLWYYDGGTLTDLGNPIGVEAYYVDLEVFQQYDLTCHTSLEVSLGVRYADYTYGTSVPGAAFFSGWQGWGGTLGLEAKRSLCLGNLYARGRLSVLMGDASTTIITPGPVVDSTFEEGNTVTQTELGIGYEVSGCYGRALVSARIGAEWQNWSNVAPGFGIPLTRDDAGWAGLVFATGVEF
jgi:hypothetical protein